MSICLFVGVGIKMTGHSQLFKDYLRQITFTMDLKNSRGENGTRRFFHFFFA